MFPIIVSLEFDRKLEDAEVQQLARNLDKLLSDPDNPFWFGIEPKPRLAAPVGQYDILRSSAITRL